MKGLVLSPIRGCNSMIAERFVLDYFSYYNSRLTVTHLTDTTYETKVAVN
jgi:hypothetical protein